MRKELFSGDTYHTSLHRNYLKVFDVEPFMKAPNICFIIMVNRASIAIPA
jgi:hypothetical protein